MVGTDPVGTAVEARGEVADDPQAVAVGGVRAHVEPGGDLADRPLEEALGREPVDQARQRPLGGVEVDHGLQQEEPGQRLERAAARRTAQRGRRLVARQRVVRGRAEQVGDPVVGEVRGHEGLTQTVRERRGHVVSHARSLEPST